MEYVGNSLYGVCVLAAQRLFPKEQFLFLRYEDVTRMQPPALLRTLSLAPLGLARPSLAADATERLRAGYDGIEALLKNWDKETFIKCGQEGQVTLAAECDRDANKVPAALGLKSTDAPLFKVEKLFKAAITPDVDIDAWNLATEQFVQHSTSAQEYAYTASFGEYNPSGGKDQVAKYMDLSKDELVLARDALRDVLKQIGGL